MTKHWYIVTDSDWEWDRLETGDQPLIFLAGSPEQAVGLAWEALRTGPNPPDGAQLKVALIDLVGFQGVEGDVFECFVYSTPWAQNSGGAEEVQQPHSAQFPDYYVDGDEGYIDDD